jgi:hypothetical protein
MHKTPPAPNPRELAHRLLAVDGETHYSAEALTRAAVHTYEQLRVHFSTFLGSAGFDALWARSLYLVRQAVPWDEPLVTSQPQPSSHRLDIVAQGRDVTEAYNVFLIIFTQFLTTLFTFIGADLGFRLLQQHWPALSLSSADNRDQEAQT